MLHFKLSRVAAAAALLFGVAQVAARTADGRAHANIPRRPSIPIVAPREGTVTSKNGTELPPYNTTYYFDQLIDHTNPSLGTFKQRYWHTYEFYEPGGCQDHCQFQCTSNQFCIGGPILLTTPGESNAAGKFDCGLHRRRRRTYVVVHCQGTRHTSRTALSSGRLRRHRTALSLCSSTGITVNPARSTICRMQASSTTPSSRRSMTWSTS